MHEEKHSSSSADPLGIHYSYVFLVKIISLFQENKKIIAKSVF